MNCPLQCTPPPSQYIFAFDLPPAETLGVFSSLVTEALIFSRDEK